MRLRIRNSHSHSSNSKRQGLAFLEAEELVEAGEAMCRPGNVQPAGTRKEPRQPREVVAVAREEEGVGD